MTKPAKLNHPSIKAGGINIYEKPSYEKPSVKKEAEGSQAPKENLSEFLPEENGGEIRYHRSNWVAFAQCLR